ncbi:MAG: hypothetical protein AAGA99_14145 [Actinomycetota bacterium]
MNSPDGRERHALTTTSTPTTASTVATSAWWRLWAVAAIAHVVGNPSYGSISSAPELRGVVNVAVGLVAVHVVGRPDDRRARWLLAVGVIASAWFEAPLLGNHWLLAALVSGAALAAGPRHDDAEWWARFTPTARVILLAFYSFAAFAKLNTGFFDSVESCAVHFTNLALSFWRLPEVAVGSGPAGVVPLVTAAIELSVPILLLVRRTRRIGVLVAVGFHVVVSLDLPRHFYDFTSVLLPLFLLFAPVGVLTTIDRRLSRWNVAAGAPSYVLASGCVVVTALPRRGFALDLLDAITWPAWLGFAGVVTWTVFRTAWTPRRVDLRPVGLGWLVVGLVVLNGLSPYLELKTATGFNMYANLVTGPEESNHLIVRSTLGLRGDHDDLAIVLDGDPRGLGSYVDSGFALPMTNLRDHLAARDEDVVFELDGEVVRSADDPTLARAQPWWQEKLFLLRAVPLGEVPACQPVWFPAR